ncbi:BLUF domain-containing protein [Ramlibacter tataouinensis]|uniref:BLUF domain-containing protein n=1 Tax=Ramlibacter tataouinensis TaxID=94132 RepID=UPI0022F38233|nr:BLUF domain-containing protein [Ramlibacter tataouinensis]WBY01784.1 BLUF domain-containing protein [Ramlibacter tataouinensis]
MQDQASNPNHSLFQPVARVVYASQANIAGSVYAQMEHIRAAAVRHNQPLGVYTALLHQSGWFIQWKEGPGGALRELMDRVAADPRHHSLRLVHASRGPRLLCGPWSMAIVQGTGTPDDMARRVALLRRKMDAGWQYAPPAVWRQLSTPLQHPGAEFQADPEAFQRVLVCSARGLLAFELVHWLAQGHGQEAVQRRFAGAEHLDVGTDYVDFQQGERVMRVIAMARRGLALPLTRAFVPDYSHVVVLLADDPAADIHLLHKVALACAHAPVRPVLLGVAARPDTHGPLLRLARELDLDYQALQAPGGDAALAWSAIEPALARWREAANASQAQPLQAVLHG